MPVYTCAVADCNSVSKKKNQGVEGWTVFPKKKDAKRRRLWETRCKRGPHWRATKDHAICSKHFIDWCQGPSPVFSESREVSRGEGCGATGSLKQPALPTWSCLHTEQMILKTVLLGFLIKASLFV